PASCGSPHGVRGGLYCFVATGDLLGATDWACVAADAAPRESTATAATVRLKADTTYEVDTVGLEADAVSRSFMAGSIRCMLSASTGNKGGVGYPTFSVFPDA